MENQKDNLDSWDNFTGNNFLKPIHVVSESQSFICTDIEIVEDAVTKVPRPRITLEFNEIAYEFDLNKTNSSKLKELGVKVPRQLIGKKVYFKKVLVRDPKKNMEVDGLRIHKID